MNHELFDERGIPVKYISYGLKPYPQYSGRHFLPYVSALDCVANCGNKASLYLSGSQVHWSKFQSC